MELQISDLSDLLDVALPLWSRRGSACSGLVWAFYGGNYNVGATSHVIADGTVTLTASTTNYVEADATTGAVSVNTSAFTNGKIPLYEVVTVATSVAIYRDKRGYQPSAAPSSGGGGATDFKQLADAPSSYTSQAGAVPRVKTDETGLEFRRVFRLVDFYDGASFDHTAGLQSPALDNAPYYGSATVGSSVFFGNPNSPEDSGIWVITAITSGNATFARRSDSELGSLWATGEFVFETFGSTVHFVSVETDSGKLDSAALDGSTVYIIENPIVDTGSVQAALASVAVQIDVFRVGARIVQCGIKTVTSADSPYTLPREGTTNPQVLLVDASAGNVTVTVSAANWNDPGATNPAYDTPHNLAAPFTIKRIDSSSNTVTVQTDSSKQFEDGSTSFTLAALASKRVIYDVNGGTKWWFI